MSEMNFCPGCGEELEENSNFCSQCGYQLKSQEKSISDETTEGVKKFIGKAKEGFSKKIGHAVIGIISLVTSLLAVITFMEIIDDGFGYRTPEIVIVISGILIGFLFIFLAGTIVSVYGINLNLIMHSKDKINLDDLLLKSKNITNKIPAFIGTSLLMMIINLAVIIAGILIWLSISNNYNYSDYTNVVFLVSSLIMIVINSRLIFSPFIVFDKKTGVISSVKESIRLTKSNTFKVIIRIIVISIINGLGQRLVVGSIITLPLSLHIITKLYYELDPSKDRLHK